RSRFTRVRYARCRKMQFPKYLDNSIALAISHIVIDWQRDYVVRSIFGMRQRKLPYGRICAHVMARRAIIFPDAQVFLLNCGSKLISIETKATFVDDHR